MLHSTEKQEIVKLMSNENTSLNKYLRIVRNLNCWEDKNKIRMRGGQDVQGLSGWDLLGF